MRDVRNAKRAEQAYLPREATQRCTVCGRLNSRTNTNNNTTRTNATIKKKIWLTLNGGGCHSRPELSKTGLSAYLAPNFIESKESLLK
jgi:hypothetical protein